MKFSEIYGMYPINAIDPQKVDQIAESIKNYGWKGCPILIYNDQLLTGSHRLAALKKLDDEGEDVLDMGVAEDVTDIVNQNIDARIARDGGAPDIDYSAIGWLLAGSWIEKNFKQEIKEW